MSIQASPEIQTYLLNIMGNSNLYGYFFNNNRRSATKKAASTSWHSELFSKSRITLLWLESRRSSLQFGPDSPFDDSSYYVWLSRLSETGW
jgi:hypothetical protein